jgi:hypothetical protein
MAVTYCYSYEKQREVNVGPRPTATTTSDCCITATSEPLGGIYRQTHQLLNQLDNGPEPAAFWAITREETPHTWNARTITEWIQEECNAIGASPPPAIQMDVA